MQNPPWPAVPTCPYLPPRVACPRCCVAEQSEVPGLFSPRPGALRFVELLKLVGPAHHPSLYTGTVKGAAAFPTPSHFSFSPRGSGAGFGRSLLCPQNLVPSLCSSSGCTCLINQPGIPQRNRTNRREFEVPKELAYRVVRLAGLRSVGGELEQDLMPGLRQNSFFYGKPSCCVRPGSPQQRRSQDRWGRRAREMPWECPRRRRELRRCRKNMQVEGRARSGADPGLGIRQRALRDWRSLHVPVFHQVPDAQCEMPA